MVLAGILEMSISAYFVVDSLDDAGVGEGKIPLLPHGDDEMLVHLDAENVGSLYDSGGEGLVFPGR
jgi:hypothetical protein